MKLLLENWKNYLHEIVVNEEEEEYDYEAEVAKEKEELEQKHFGASANIGQMLYDIYQEELKYLQSQGVDPDDIFDVVQTKFNKLNSSNKISSNSLENSGRGLWRAVFSCDKDYVIKIDASIDGSGADMNREDQQLGTNKKYGDIFPRVFMFDPKYKWIVAEKVTVATSPIQINKFFPNFLLQDSFMYKYTYLSVVKTIMEYKVAQLKGNKQMMQQCSNTFQEFKQTGIAYSHYVTIEKVVDNFRKNPNFFKIVSAIFEHGIDIEDAIRPENMGIGNDGRLVILDSSIASTLDKGRSGMSQ